MIDTRMSFAWRFRVYVLSFGFAVIFGGSARADDWPTWRGPRMDGISKEKDWNATWPATGPKIAWTRTIGVGYAAVIVVGDRVFAMGYEDGPEEEAAGTETIYCLDANTGKEQWKQSYSAFTNKNLNAGGPAATPTFHQGRLYLLSRDGQFRCLDAAKGEVIWKQDLAQLVGKDDSTWGLSSSGVIIGDRILYQVGGAVALDCRTGELAWKTTRHKIGYSTPTVFERGGRKLATFMTGDGVALIDVDKQKELDFHPWKADYDIHSATPVMLADGRIFTSSSYGKGCVFFEVEGDKLKSVIGSGSDPLRTMRNSMSGCVLHEGFLYGYDDEKLTCISATTGETAWVAGTRELLGKGSLMLAGDKLIVISGPGTLATVEANPKEFRRISAHKLFGKNCWTMPTLANGRIYCRNDQGELACVDVRK